LSLSVVIYTCTVLLGFLQGFTDTLQTWHGYYSLLVPVQLDLASVENYLIQGGVEQFVSAQNAQVDISTFGGMQRLALEKLPGRLAADDVRRTPWLDTIDGLFFDESRTHHIIYVYQKEPLARLSLRMEEIFKPVGIPWQIAEWNPTDRIVVASLIAAAGVLCAIVAKGIRWSTLAAVIPWAMVALGFGPRLFPLFALLLLAMTYLSEKLVVELHRFVVEIRPQHFFWELIHRPRQAWKALRKMGSFAASPALFLAVMFYAAVTILVILLCALSGEGTGAGGVLLLTMVCWPAILIWITYAYQARTKRNEHRLYFPVPILHRYRGPGLSLPLRIAILGIFSLILPGLFLVAPSSIKGLSIPVPLSKPENQEINMDRLSALYHSHFFKPSLPDLSLLVAHRVHQEALAWVRPAEWSKILTPGAGFGLQIQVPSAPGSDRPSSLFANDSWLQDYRASIKDHSVEGILFSQGQAVGLAYSSVHGVYSVDIWSLTGILMFGLLSILSMCIRRTPGFLPGARRYSIWGKKSTV
jgi:hypothetical protein